MRQFARLLLCFLQDTIIIMRYELNSTEMFDVWIAELDGSLKRRIANRLLQVECGNFGDHKMLTATLFELRSTFGGGVRIYYTLSEKEIVLLLAGGNKSSQEKDIASAKILLLELD